MPADPATPSPAATTVRPTPTSSFALPSLTEVEELLASLPGVISARVVETEGGGVGDVHVLTGAEVPPKQTVRNVESALLAHFGVRIDHRKISVATTTDAARARAVRSAQAPAAPAAPPAPVEGRRVYFDDIETRRSSRGMACKVTLRKGESRFDGEAESVEGARARAEEVAARAAMSALARAEGSAAALSLEGAQVVAAFGREFVFVGVTARVGRGTSLLAGSCEVRDSLDEAAALAVLDATNRWVARGR